MECKRYPAVHPSRTVSDGGRLTSSPALRMLFGVAVACGLGAPAAMQVSALESSEPALFTQEHWPTVRWIDPPAFVIAGLAASSEAATSIDKVVPVHVDVGDRAGRLLMLLQRLAWEAEAHREPSMFDFEVELPSWLTRQRVPVPRDEAVGGPAVGEAPDATPAPAGVSTVAAAPAFRKASSNKVTRQRLSIRRGRGGPNAFGPEPPQQLSADWNDLLPIRRMPLLPWIAFAFALLGAGWIGWRGAAPAVDSPSPPPPSAAPSPSPT